MFLVGISAHLLIYLLVPAFLVVCFYFKGTTGNPEISVLVPETRVYEQNISRYSSDTTYVYSIRKQKTVIKPVYSEYPIFTDRTEYIIYQLIPGSSFVLSEQQLRAPPVH